MATTTPKMKLSERVQNRDERGRFAPGFQEEVDQPEVNQAVSQPVSSTSAAKVVAERDTNLRTNKLMEAANDIQEDTLDVDKKLLKAVSDLTKTMQFGYKKAQEEKKKGLAGFVQGKIASVKKAFTLEGAAGMAGIGRDDGSLKGAILGSVLQRKDEKAKKAEYIAKFGQFTEKGRQLGAIGGVEGQKAVAAEGQKRYEQLTKADKDISRLETMQEQAKSVGGNLSKEEMDALLAAKATKNELSGDPKEKRATREKAPKTSKKDELLAGVAAGVTAEISALSPEEKKTLNTADPEYLKGVFEGALGSLTEVNEKQLDQLVALVRASTMSEEDKMESKNKDNMLTSIQDPKEEKKKEDEGGGWMKTIMNMFGNFGSLLKGLPGMLMGALSGIGAKLFGGAAKLAAPLLGAGKAIVGGAAKALPAVAEFGSKVASKALPFVTDMGTKVAGIASKALPAVAEAGTKAAGVGTKALGGLSKFGGLAKGVLGKLGPVAMAGMAAYDAVSGFNEAGANLGIEGREATTGEKLSSAAGSAVSGLTFGLLGKDTASKGIASLFGAGPPPEKTATPNRVSQTDMLAANTEDLQMMSEKKEVAAPTVVNSAPTTIINQGDGGKSQAPRTPIRNPEISYNHRLTRYFVG
jgi:hypothetical protein